MYHPSERLDSSSRVRLNTSLYRYLSACPTTPHSCGLRTEGLQEVRRLGRYSTRRRTCPTSGAAKRRQGRPSNSTPSPVLPNHYALGRLRLSPQRTTRFTHSTARPPRASSRSESLPHHMLVPSRIPPCPHRTPYRADSRRSGVGVASRQIAPSQRFDDKIVSHQRWRDIEGDSDRVRRAFPANNRQPGHLLTAAHPGYRSNKCDFGSRPNRKEDMQRGIAS